MGVKEFFQEQLLDEQQAAPSLERFLDAAVERRDELALHSDAKDALTLLESLHVQGELMVSLESPTPAQITAFKVLSQQALEAYGFGFMGDTESGLVATLEGIGETLTKFRAFVVKLKDAKKPKLRDKDAYRDSARLAREIGRTYANIRWLDRQAFVTEPVSARDISTYLSLRSGVTQNPKADVEKDIAINQTEIKNWQHEIQKRGQDLKAARKLLSHGEGTEEEFQRLREIFRGAYEPYVHHKPQTSTHLGARKVTPPATDSRRGRPYALSDPAFDAVETIPPLTKDQVRDCARLILAIKDILYKNFYHEILDNTDLDIRIGEDVPVVERVIEAHGDGGEVDRWINEIYANFEYDANDVESRWYRPAAIRAFDDALLDIALALAKWIDRSIK